MKKNDIVITFLLSSRFHILRHLLLFVFIFVISAGFTWQSPEEGVSSIEKYIALVFYVVIFLGTIYFNVYVLVPKLLLKNRWLLYFMSLGVVVILIMFFIFIVQDFFYTEDKPIENRGYFIVIINILSAILSFVFLFAGTTTIILFRHWITDMQRAEELESTTLQSELKLLKSQINPHFLFNMLNNANIMVHEDPEVSSRILLKLDDLLQYQINDSTKDKVSLSADILFLTDFLDLEKTRRDDFSYTLSKDGNLDEIEVPPLIFIPFIENAVKHNQDSNDRSYVDILFRVLNEKLEFICENSKPLNPMKRDTGGLGLANIKRRLDLLYGNNYSLEIKDMDTTYTVILNLKL